MKFGSFKYLVKQGLKNMGANRLMSFASIGVLTACFILTGVAALLWANVDNIVDYLAGQNEIVVYLLPDLEEEQALQVGEQIKVLPNVNTVEYVSKADAYLEMQNMLEGFADITGYERIFPASYNVTVQDLNYIESTNAQLAGIVGVERTYVPVDLAGAIITIKNAVTYGGMGIVVVLAAVSVVVIINTIRLTVFARRREISIMKYVGATNAFIRLPFFVEGMAVGIIAGLVSTGVVCLGYYLVYNFLQSMHNLWLLGILDSVYPLSAIWPYVLVCALGLGMLLGGIGTAFSVRKHLKV